MKKQTLKKLLALSVSALLFSGFSLIAEEEDVYEIDDTPEYADTYSETEDEDTEIRTAKKKKSGIADLFKFGNKDKFLFIEDTDNSVFSKNLTGSLKQKAATITIDPYTAEAGFGTQYLAGYYYVLFNKETRKALNKAMNQYYSDFENKTLIRKTTKTAKAYGKAKVKLWWGTIKSSTPNNGLGTMNIGYEFVNKSPYFTISLPEIQNEYYKVTDSAPMGSTFIKFYFTKSQIKKLLENLSEETISNEINNFILAENGTPQGSDDY